MNNPAYIPNSYQTPNVLIDEIMPLLTPEEWVVLSFAIRHILGWKDKITSRQAEISLTQFEKTNISRKTIVKVLDALVHYGLLSAIGDPTIHGQCWQLCFDESVDIAGLQQRFNERQSKRIKTRKGRKSTSGVGRTPSVGSTPSSTPPQAERGGVGSTHNKTQSIQTQETQSIAPAKAVASPEPETLAQTEKKPQPSKSGLEKNPPSSARPPLAKQTPELKDAIALLCKGTVTAWNAESVAKSLAKALREVLALQPDATAQDFTAFKAWWDKCDFRGQKGQRPAPNQVPGAWVEWQASKQLPAQPKTPTVDYVPDPENPGSFITRKRYEAMMKAKATHA